MNRGSVSLPLLLAVIAALAVAYFIHATHSRRQPSPAAQAMIVGKAGSEAAIVPGVDDKRLSDDEKAAGALWADKHPSERCPSEPAGFHQGCNGAR